MAKHDREPAVLYTWNRGMADNGPQTPPFTVFGDYRSLSEDPENDNLCVARERQLETEALDRLGIARFQIVDGTVLDRKGDVLNDLSGYRILIRSDVKGTFPAMDSVLALGGSLVVDKDGSDRVSRWFEHIDVGRPVIPFRFAEMDPDNRLTVPERIRFGDHVFIKTVRKRASWVVVVDNPLEAFGYSSCSLPLDMEMLGCPVMDIASSGQGKEEYRFFVAGDEPGQGSRYTDYGDPGVPPETVSAKALEMAQAAEAAGFPETFVVDICLLEDGTAACVEFNDVCASGRYAGNDPERYFRSLFGM